MWFVGLLVGYWAAMKLVPVPGFGAGQLTLPLVRKYEISQRR